MPVIPPESNVTFSVPVLLPAGSPTATALRLGGTSYGWCSETVNGLPAWVWCSTGARRTVLFWDLGIKIPATCEVAWSDTDGVADKPETGLSLRRDLNNQLAQRNGTAAQSYVVYNTWTDASHFERLDIGWFNNTAHMWTTKGGNGGAAQDLVLGADATEVIRLQPSKVSFFAGTPVVQQTCAALINNLPLSGPNNTVNDFADGDWAGLRAALSQATEKIKDLTNVIRAYNLAG